MVPDRPISFEVFSDDFDEMEQQARRIAEWGANVYVKIPVTNTPGGEHGAWCARLAAAGVQLNVTAADDPGPDRSTRASQALAGGPPAYISVFAGRIADTGVDPMPIMAEAVELLVGTAPDLELIWASPREVLNIVQADADRLPHHHRDPRPAAKLDGLGKDLDEFSLETVQMFHDDARTAGYTL